MSPYLVLLYLHIIGAVVAFGPGFSAMVTGPMVAKEPQHANFFARTQLAVSLRLVTPASLSMAVTGILIIAVQGWTNLTGGRWWLTVSIVLYIIAVGFSVLVQAPAGRRLVELTSSPPAPGTPPDPALPATAARLRYGGMFLSLLVLVIALFMVTKPF